MGRQSLLLLKAMKGILLKGLASIILAVIVAVCAYSLGETHRPATLFSDFPPTDFTAGSTITSSAICSFKKIFNVADGFQDGNQNTSLNYNFSDDNPSDTVSFTALDTNNPVVVNNTGQSQLTVIHDDGDSITMVDGSTTNGNFVTYRLYRKEKVLIYEDTITLLIPQANLEMGYCH